MNTQKKLEKLKNRLKSLKRVAVAFSGGVDSTFLLKVAHDCLNGDCIAITTVSPVTLNYEKRDIAGIIQKLKIKHIFIDSKEMKDPYFRSNTADRCYLCKKIKCGAIIEYTEQNGYGNVIDGTNVDDRHDYRPGNKALEELGVLSPLEEAGLTKNEIRELSRSYGLPTWNKPEDACLASRIPYGTEITEAILEQIDNAEQILREKGFRNLRVRYHQKIARIEIIPEHFNQLLSIKEDIVSQFQAIGFQYITLDLAGFRSGSMNEIMSEMPRQANGIVLTTS